MDLIIKFVTYVVAGKYNDLVGFGPQIVVNGKPITLEAWVPRNKKARKGSEVTGTPTIEVEEGTQITKSYTKDGVEVLLPVWKLRVVVSGDYEFSQPKTVSLQDFFRDNV